MTETTFQDHLHLPLATVQLFGTFHFKSTPEKDSKKAVVTITMYLIYKIKPKVKVFMINKKILV
jgi:hypothetical protein